MLKDQDRHYRAGITVFLAGIGSLLTFMVILSAPDYLDIAYPEYPNLLTLWVGVFNTFEFIGLIVMLSPMGRRLSISLRLQLGYTVNGIFTLLIPAIPFFYKKMEYDQYEVLVFIVFSGVICGLVSAAICTSLFSFAAMLPNEYSLDFPLSHSLSLSLSAFVSDTDCILGIGTNVLFYGLQ